MSDYKTYQPFDETHKPMSKSQRQDAERKRHLQRLDHVIRDVEDLKYSVRKQWTSGPEPQSPADEGDIKPFDILMCRLITTGIALICSTVTICVCRNSIIDIIREFTQ